jgi:hypothetical protein
LHGGICNLQLLKKGRKICDAIAVTAVLEAGNISTVSECTVWELSNSCNFFSNWKIGVSLTFLTFHSNPCTMTTVIKQEKMLEVPNFLPRDGYQDDVELIP